MKLVLDRNSALPFYSQIKQILLEELQDPNRVEGPALTEASLMQRFSVSRAPARQALQELEDEGHVVRHRAKGTFPVRGVNVSLPPALELGGISQYLTERGLKPTSRVVGLERVDPPAEVEEALGLVTPTSLLRVQRVIYVEGSPLVWSSTYLRTPEDFFPDKEELERAGTVFSVIDRELGMTFSRGVQHIWASGASQEEAQALKIDSGAPVLVAVTTLFTRDGKPAGWRRAVHRSDDFKYAFGLNR